MQRSPIWITGIGAATPLGNDFATFSENLLAGKSATRVIVDQNGETELRSPGSRIDEVPLAQGWNESAFRALPKVEQLSLWCASAALVDAGWWAIRDRLRIGIVLGVGGEWLHYWEKNTVAGGRHLYEGGETESLAGATQRRLEVMGPIAIVGAACASANYAIAKGKRWLELGLVDVCLAGGLEVTTAICRSGFNNLRAMSRNVENAERSSRPFDCDRDGFVMGEGGALFAMESAEVARRRGAKALAEVAGFGASSDAYHMIIPSSDPAPASRAMQSALVDAKIAPQDVDYINAHATSTPVGDKAETRAIHSVFGSHTKSVPVSSTKSMTGHLLSAAAAIEAMACVTALQRQATPPTINLDRPDPECDLCHVPNQSQPRAVRAALSNSFGFGGSNTTLVLRKAA
jgi:3-oxoacyl-[acyl-carrier-protein] synthase II